jgi:bile acid:Na+ symporter, BASS family
MAEKKSSIGVVLKKLGRAIIFFIVFAIAIPLAIGYLYGVPAGAILSLIGSAILLQAAAPPVGLALGLEPVGIVIVMAFFALGMVLAIYEACESLGAGSERVRRWIDSMEEKTRKYPQIQKYGPISCTAIAWIPGIGLYGTPIISWILKWKRLLSTAFTVAGFTIASIFVLFFMQYIEVFARIFLLVGVIGVVICAVATMLSLAFTFTIPDIAATLKNYRLMGLSLIASFIIVPLVASLMIRYANLSQEYSTGLAIIAAAAGATFLLKLTTTVKGNTAPVGGLMVLATVVTVAFMPLVLPFLVPGMALNIVGIAEILVLLILIPLGLGLFARARSQEATTRYAPLATKISVVSLGAVIVGFLGGNFQGFLGIFGTGTILAILAFLFVAFLAGYVLGGPDQGTRRVMAFATGQRNLAAAALAGFVASGPSFPSLFSLEKPFLAYPDVIIMVVVTGLVGLILFMVVGKRVGGKGS